MTTQINSLHAFITALAVEANQRGVYAASAEEYILRTGKRLSKREAAIARAVGVRRLEQARVLILRDRLPACPGIPSDLIRRAEKALHAIKGVCIGRGIIIRQQFASSALIAHELAHVAQYERLGGLGPFLTVYLRDPRPFEAEADRESARVTRSPGALIASEAQRWVGVPTRTNGRDRNGVDCLGLVLCVHTAAGIDLGPFLRAATLEEKAFIGREGLKFFRDVAEPQDGDVLTMQSAKASEPHHLGIYNNANVIHANSKHGKVIREPLSGGLELRVVKISRLNDRIGCSAPIGQAA